MRCGKPPCPPSRRPATACLTELVGEGDRLRRFKWNLRADDPLLADRRRPGDLETLVWKIHEALAGADQAVEIV
jgi:hypothetical protein